MPKIIIYGPKICHKCDFTIRSFGLAGLTAEKVVVDDAMHEAILASKLAIKAARLNVEPHTIELTDEEKVEPMQAPFVWIDDVFVWIDARPDLIAKFIAEYAEERQLESVDA